MIALGGAPGHGAQRARWTEIRPESLFRTCHSRMAAVAQRCEPIARRHTRIRQISSSAYTCCNGADCDFFDDTQRLRSVPLEYRQNINTAPSGHRHYQRAAA